MKQEEEQLLLQDLCARLPYGVFCEGITTDIDIDTDRYYNHKVKGVLSNIHHYKCNYAIIGLMSECELETIKPYLLPLSSMTEEQKEEYNSECKKDLKTLSEAVLNRTYTKTRIETPLYYGIDWLNKHHFDYRGLIEKGLALDATGKNIY